MLHQEEKRQITKPLAIPDSFLIDMRHKDL